MTFSSNKFRELRSQDNQFPFKVSASFRAAELRQKKFRLRDFVKWHSHQRLNNWMISMKPLFDAENPIELNK